MIKLRSRACWGLLFQVAAYSCSGGDITGPGPGGSGQPTSEALVIDSTRLSLTPDSAAQAAGTYTFEVLPGAPSIAADQVIVGAQAGGFLRRVSSVSKVGSRITVETSQAGLTDVVLNGSLKNSVHLSLDSTQANGADPKIYWGPTRVTPLVAPILVENGEIVLDGAPLASTPEFDLIVEQGRIRFDPTVTLDLDIRGSRVQRLTNSATGTLVFDADVLLESRATLLDNVIAEQVLFVLTKPFVATIGVVPVAGEVALTFKATGQVGTAGAVQATSGFRSSTGVTVGASYDRSADPSWSLIKGTTASFTPQQLAFSVTADAYAQVGVQVELRLTLYRIAGPYAYAQGFAKAGRTVDLLAGEIRDRCTAGIQGGVGFDAKIFDFALVRFDKSETFWSSTFCSYDAPLNGPQFAIVLSASPSTGTAPLNDVDLTATVNGTAAGTSNYTFYCNRPDPATNITPEWARKFDGQTETSKTAVDACDYPSPGTYSAKVIVERGTLAVEARVPITVSPGPPPPAEAEIAFTSQPSDVPAGRNVFPAGFDIYPAFHVTVRDANGNPLPSFNLPVSLALSANACGGTLSGGGSVTPGNGSATFANVRIDRPCPDYILRASAEGATSGTSAPFRISIPGDLNLDGRVNDSDNEMMLGDFGKIDRPPSDINKDGAVDVQDLGILLQHWTVATGTATSATSTSAVLNGGANPNWIETSVWFEWGPDPALATFSSTPAQPIGSGATSQAFTATLTDLVPNTAFYFRAVAASQAGTVRDPAIQSFQTSPGTAGIFAESGIWGGLNGLPPSDLYVVEPSEEGSDQKVGRIQIPNGSRPLITDLARSPDGSLYAISTERLYKVDPLTGGAIEVGLLGLNIALDADGSPDALAFDRDGNLFGATTNGTFFQVELATGRATVRGSFRNGLDAWGDIAFAPDGRLFGAARTASGGAVLVTIDRNTGQATEVNPGSSLRFANVWGLAFVGDELFGLTTESTLVQTATGTLVRIDTNSGTTSVVRKLSFDAFGGT